MARQVWLYDHFFNPNIPAYDDGLFFKPLKESPTMVTIKNNHNANSPGTSVKCLVVQRVTGNSKRIVVRTTLDNSDLPFELELDSEDAKELAEQLLRGVELIGLPLARTVIKGCF